MSTQASASGQFAFGPLDQQPFFRPALAGGGFLHGRTRQPVPSACVFRAMLTRLAGFECDWLERIMG